MASADCVRCLSDIIGLTRTDSIARRVDVGWNRAGSVHAVVTTTSMLRIARHWKRLDVQLSALEFNS